MNEAIALAEGEFVLTLGSEDKLAPTALYLVTHAINNQRDLRLIYSDEDKLDSAGFRTEPHFKSDWNWPLLLGQDFISQLTVFHSDLVRSFGWRTILEERTDTIFCCGLPRGSSHTKSIIFLTSFIIVELGRPAGRQV